MYASEDRMAKVLAIFSGLSILIACLGLFALTWFMSQAKAKELAIRQSLGGSFAHLIVVATREPMTIVLMSGLLGTIASIFGTNLWLESFSYRVQHDPLIYILVIFLALLIAFITMFYHAYEASTRNPVKVLKYE